MAQKRFFSLLPYASAAFILCASSFAQGKSKSINNHALIERATKAAAYKLKDPSSAQFRNVFIARTGDVCGEMNAKNSYGAYVGFQEFYYDDDTKEVTILDPSDDYYKVNVIGRKLVCDK